MYHLTEGKSKNPRFFDDHLEDHQPFPTLEDVLTVLDQHAGCNIEIKWTMQLHDGSYELYNPVDINVYVDTILEVHNFVYSHEVLRSQIYYPVNEFDSTYNCNFYLI